MQPLTYPSAKIHSLHVVTEALDKDEPYPNQAKLIIEESTEIIP